MNQLQWAKSSTCRSPEIGVEIDGVVGIKDNSLTLQQLFLQIITIEPVQGDAPVAIYHPVPGQSILFGTGMQYPSHLPCRTGIAGAGCDQTIGRHFARRDHPDQVFDGFGKRCAH
jgi:hypothetical protein